MENPRIEPAQVPFFKSWRSWYILVLGSHFIFILLFFLLMKFFN